MIQLVGALSLHHKVMSLIPSQGRCLGCAFNLLLGSIREATNRCFSVTPMFLSLFSPSPLSKNNEKVSLGEDRGKKKKVSKRSKGHPRPEDIMGLS